MTPMEQQVLDTIERDNADWKARCLPVPFAENAATAISPPTEAYFPSASDNISGAVSYPFRVTISGTSFKVVSGGNIGGQAPSSWSGTGVPASGAGVVYATITCALSVSGTSPGAFVYGGTVSSVALGASTSLPADNAITGVFHIALHNTLNGGLDGAPNVSTSLNAQVVDDNTGNGGGVLQLCRQ